jgi:hypothetical protein
MADLIVAIVVGPHLGKPTGIATAARFAIWTGLAVTSEVWK